MCIRDSYNGLLQDEVVSPSEVKEFADLSEQELDRIETLVQNLLKITPVSYTHLPLRRLKAPLGLSLLRCACKRELVGAKPLHLAVQDRSVA